MKYNDDNKEFIAFQSGDKGGYVHLFRRFYRSLCLFGTQFNLTKEEAEEAAQDVLLQAWYKRSNFESLGKLSAFLYVSMRNASLNLLDKNIRLRNNQKHYHSVTAESYDLNGDQFSKMVYAETLNRLREVFNNLPPQCAKVMTLHLLEGYSIDEVSKEMGITASTVYVQKKKGLDYLKSILSPEDFFVVCLLVYGFL